MNFGKLIYYHRKQKGWSQSQLCQDICSVTHLSKIENGSKEVHLDLIENLCKKLNVSIESETEKLAEINSMIQDCLDSFQRKNFILAKQLIESLEKYSTYIKYTEFLFIYELTLAWFYIIEDKLNKADNLLKKLGEFIKKFSQYEFCLFYFIMSLYHLKQNCMIEAWDELEKINELNNSQIFNEKITEYYFYKALLTARLNRNGLSIHYCYKALAVFERQHNFKRILDTELLLAIELIKSGDYTRSEAILLNVNKNAMLYNDQLILKSSLHNLGYLYFQKKNYRKANEYYYKAIKLVEENSSAYYSLNTNIIQNYIYLNEINKAKEISETILESMPDPESSDYIKIRCLYLESNNLEDELMEYLTTIAIPKMIQEQNNKKTIEYKEKLIDYLLMKKEFEQASYHLMDCNRLLKEISI